MVRKPETEEDMMPDTTITTRPLVVSPFTAFGQRVEPKFKDNKVIYLHPQKSKQMNLSYQNSNLISIYFVEKDFIWILR